MHPLVSRVLEIPGVKSLADRLGAGRPSLGGGLWGSSSALITAALRVLRPHPLLFVASTPSEADEICEDLATFLGEMPVRMPEQEGGDPTLRSQRLRAVSQWSRGAVVVASARGVIQKLPACGREISLSVGQKLDRDRWTEQLMEAGLNRSTVVEMPGEYAVRGGVVDFFPLGLEQPLRVEFSGDEIESIRSFRIEDQRTVETFPEVHWTPSLSGLEEGTVASRLPETAWVVMREPGEVREEGWPECYTALSARPRLVLQSLPGEGVNFRALSLQRFSGRLSNVAQELEALAPRRVQVFCAQSGEEERLRELLKDSRVSTTVEVVSGRINHGFVLEEIGIAVVPHQELFQRNRMRRPVRRGDAGLVDTLLDLEPGDLVVHRTHGIARFVGMERLKGQERLVLEYSGGARLFVPVANVDLVEKYLGGTERAPALSTLGGKGWNEAKERAEKSAVKLATELLQVQARRQAETGIAFPSDGEWQRAFEAAFPYEETDDQLEVARQISTDMTRPKPMDRLICGDVGYGKTELAMRAAFRAAAAHRQVAVLVPTTVLAQQHYQSFRERMADYPFEIAVLSRFKSKAEQKEILQRLEEGTVDIVIGTHRLVQADVRFRDLGLVVIDEEQRFGVEHKERLKHYRAMVDVLTLTATPIPRTLHMSFLGIRDISSLTTAPQDRRAVRTEVLAYDERRIAEAIRFELSRKGQVYFVHNRVWNIREVARRLELLVPEARFGVGHGQMDADELEETMLRFLAGETDVLVSTTIIESGLDIPNVNTIFIHDADRFGLADLHQLRGRVGRYKVQAFCYLLLPRDRPILSQARKRIKALEEFSELGAGFKIAMRDLEIRGVGNLLGREQHGNIASVGYEMYCRMLTQASRKLRKMKPLEDPAETVVDLGVEARIPEEYIPDLRTRIEAYRRLCGARDMKELEAARHEAADRFGALPEEVETLVRLVAIKLFARSYGFTSVVQGDGAVVCRYRDRSKAEALRRRKGGVVRIVDGETIHIVPAGGGILEGVLAALS